MAAKRRAVCAFWIFHIALCVLFAAPDVFHLAQRSVWRVLRPYGVYTGAASRYGFFAPNVPSARRVRVRVLCGENWIPVDAPLRGPESQLRLSTITSLLMYKEVEESVAASWAAYGFGKLDCGEAALVEVDYYEIPPIQDYRHGARPQWTLLRVFAFAAPGVVKPEQLSKP
jgi:hypothetical protein